MPRTLAYSRIDDALAVLVHADLAPDDAEWDAWLADLERWLPELRGLLIVTDHHGPTSGQRRRLGALLARVGPVQARTAVLSSSRLARGIVIAVNLFNPDIRAFSPADVDAAAHHIGAASGAADLMTEVERLRRILRG